MFGEVIELIIISTKTIFAYALTVATLEIK